MDEETLEIRAVGVTTSNVGDAPMLADLLEQIPPEQESAAITADGAYDTRRCHNEIVARGAAAIIPPRKNAQLWKPTMRRRQASGGVSPSSAKPRSRFVSQ